MLVADLVLMTTMLPAIQQTSPNLRDVFRSAEASVLGLENRLGLGSATSAIVLMVDGLGYNNLNQNGEGFLATRLGEFDFLTCGFPSTTAASLASFATGEDCSTHGLFGYSIFDRALGETVNLLSGLDRFSILDYLKVPPISESSPVPVHAVTLQAYENSGFTRATMHGAIHHFIEGVAQRLAEALRIAVEHPGSLVYVYVPEIDREAHRSGLSSAASKTALHSLEREVQTLVAKLPRGVGLLVTADHGVVDIDPSAHIFLDDLNGLSNLLESVCGDPRAPFVYLKSAEQLNSVREKLTAFLGSKVVVCTPSDLVRSGYWQEQMLLDAEILPDLVLVTVAEVVIFHRDFAKPSSLLMVGHHGSVSETEMKIPLIRFGAYSSSLLVP